MFARLSSAALALISLAGQAAGAAVADGKFDPLLLSTGFDAGQLDIRLSRQTSNAVQSPWLVHVSGAGTSTFSRNGKTWPLPYAASAAVTLLNELYAIHFFDLPAQYAPPDVARLRADGSVVVLHNHVSNNNLNSVCVRIVAAEKCVRFGSQAPLDLDRIFKHQFAQAERLAGAPAGTR